MQKISSISLIELYWIASANVRNMAIIPMRRFLIHNQAILLHFLLPRWYKPAIFGLLEMGRQPILQLLHILISPELIFFRIAFQQTVFLNLYPIRYISRRQGSSLPITLIRA